MSSIRCSSRVSSAPCPTRNGSPTNYPAARRDDELRGCARSEPAIRPGAHVPDRRAHSVGLGVGRTGRRTVRAARRCRHPRRCTRASKDDFAATHGRVRGQETAILALGRLGAQEMTANSDLDLIVIYDYDKAHPDSDGARSLYGAQYFARFTQRLISALTVKTNYGALYPVECGCGRRAAPGRWRRRSTALSVIRSARPGPGSTWRSPRARRLRRRRIFARAWKPRSAPCSPACASRARSPRT